MGAGWGDNRKDNYVVGGYTVSVIKIVLASLASDTGCRHSERRDFKKPRKHKNCFPNTVASQLDDAQCPNPPTREIKRKQNFGL